MTLGPTGILHVMSSAYLVIKVFREVGLISLTMMAKRTGPRTVIIITVVISILIKTAFWQTSIHSQSLEKSL